MAITKISTPTMLQFHTESATRFYYFLSPKPLPFSPPPPSINKNKINPRRRSNHQLSSSSAVVNGGAKKKKRFKVVAATSGNVAVPNWDTWIPDKASPPPSLSDVLWPALGGFVAMAMFGKIDQMLAPRGVSMTIAPLGAVSAVLFITPKSPGARKYNMFMAQIGCAAIGVVALTLLGPGWLARSAALAASLAFMVYTRCTHPPAASLPLLFIDGVKLHHLNFWYALFPGAAGCILIAILQEIVCYLKENFKF